MQQTRCINCLKIITPEAKKCPYCGYDQNYKMYNYNESLRLNTILKGRYLVGRNVGRGPFGITYVGRDLTIEKKVAVREFYPDYDWHGCNRGQGTNRIMWDDKIQSGNDSEKHTDYIDRVFKQAQQVARLPDSLSITKVYDAFLENGTVYIVEEFVEGEELRWYFSDHGPMTWNECKQMLFPVMEGLAKAHDSGLVHGAISPFKIIIQTDGTAKLTDLEIENSVVESIKEAAPELGELPLLPRGFFMAPDVYAAQFGFDGSPRKTNRTDIYAFAADVYAFAAVVLYCVTGDRLMSCFDRLHDLKWWQLLLTQSEDLTDVRALFKGVEEVPTSVKKILSNALGVGGRIFDMRQFRDKMIQAEKDE